MKPSALILQHTAQERGGLFEVLIEEQGWQTEILRLFDGAELPASPEGFDLILSLGGPMSANQERAYPFLKKEAAFLHQALKMGQPVLGICLGAQLMAKALGARVYPGPHKEIGWYWLNQTPAGRADPLFSRLDPCFLVFQWHGETFDLPPGAACLAGNRAYPHQAFRFGLRAYGLQFHLELDLDLLQSWLSAWEAEISEARPQPITAPDILRDGAIYLERLQDQARRWLSGYLSLIFAPRETVR
ncbi:MAG: gamma-glutamyl-gamma-aminobutyrate hydrolase family protein [Deltaproteobacteria bacterium]|nr:gamma-glutamyl-gamma-aminobutyrate hydrolase family protein [Deltaproteobacteria bacterium]